jgi:hypothetical protein
VVAQFDGEEGKVKKEVEVGKKVKKELKKGVEIEKKEGEPNLGIRKEVDSH